jgi:hypothetical protein
MVLLRRRGHTVRCLWGMPMIQLPGSVPLRISGYLEERPNGCWTWGKAHSTAGYACVWWNRSQRSLHRVLYELLRGPVPVDMVLDHVVCEDRSCPNPWHVEPTTNIANLMRERVRAGHCWGCEHGTPRCDDCYRAYYRNQQRIKNGTPLDKPVGKYSRRSA